MNKYIIALVSVVTMIFLTVQTHAQLIDVARSDDSTILIEKVYAGILATTSYIPAKDTIIKSVSFRVGGAARYDISRSFTLKAFTAWDVDPLGKNTTGFNAFYLQYKPSKYWLIDAGYGPTLTAQQHRPHPVTNWGQFEPSTPARLPGIAPKLNIQVIPSAKLLFAGGISLREKKPEYQLTTTLGKLQVTGYYQTYDSLTGAALTYLGKHFSTTLVYKTITHSRDTTNNVIADLATYKISKKYSISVYSDFGYSFISHDIIRWEGGALKIFTSKCCKGLYGVGYDYTLQWFKTYFFLTL